MKIVDLPLDAIGFAPWNSNRMDNAMHGRLRESMTRYGLVEPLVVRPVAGGAYELISGNQRLHVLRQMGWSEATCFIVDLDDVRARLLSQALNHIRGEDDLGLRAELLRKVLETVPEGDVLLLLPETSNSLQALASLGQEEMAEHLEAWQKAQAARLKHLRVELTLAQLKIVEDALKHALARGIPTEHSPNRRGTALVTICRVYLSSKRGAP